MPFSNRPLYLQVRDALAERIASGRLKPGSSIPNEGDLAREIGVSAGTIRKALQLMETDRLIVRRQGRGTFVSDPSPDELAARFMRLHGPDGTCIRGQIRLLAIARSTANELERSRLQLSTGDEVYRLRRVRRHHDGVAFLVEDATLPADVFPGLGDRSQNSDYIGGLAQEYGVLLGNAQERLSTAVPPSDIAQILGAGAPVLMLDRVVFTAGSSRVVEWRLAYCHFPGSCYYAELR